MKNLLVDLSRREMLKLMGAGTAALALPPTALAGGGQPMPRLGLQLYTVRAALEHDFEATIRRVAELSFLGIETYALPAKYVPASKMVPPWAPVWCPVATTSRNERLAPLLERRARLLGLDRPVLSRSIDIDVTQLTDEQLQRIVDGEDPVAVLAMEQRVTTDGRAGRPRAPCAAAPMGRAVAPHL